ncbi:hypothetical protein M231_08100 [Tremella mesenterica]|uniref:Uncharacterized protein n=1 Tax=Tremella mesenterica TaxID=5217 RepID=A0A4Q1BD49_TREME|nr:hypothetical protein M231_08100 [Tremella mesenterica]
MDARRQNRSHCDGSTNKSGPFPIISSGDPSLRGEGTGSSTSPLIIHVASASALPTPTASSSDIQSFRYVYSSVSLTRLREVVVWDGLNYGPPRWRYSTRGAKQLTGADLLHKMTKTLTNTVCRNWSDIYWLRERDKRTMYRRLDIIFTKRAEIVATLNQQLEKALEFVLSSNSPSQCRESRDGSTEWAVHYTRFELRRETPSDGQPAKIKCDLYLGYKGEVGYHLPGLDDPALLRRGDAHIPVTDLGTTVGYSAYQSSRTQFSPWYPVSRTSFPVVDSFGVNSGESDSMYHTPEMQRQFLSTREVWRGKNGPGWKRAAVAESTTQLVILTGMDLWDKCVKMMIESTDDVHNRLDGGRESATNTGSMRDQLQPWESLYAQTVIGMGNILAEFLITPQPVEKVRVETDYEMREGNRSPRLVGTIYLNDVKYHLPVVIDSMIGCPSF